MILFIPKCAVLPCPLLATLPHHLAPMDLLSCMYRRE
jgi:hypothetical protein